MVLGHRRHSAASSRSVQTDDKTEQVTKEDETVVDEEQGNVLSHIISQLRPGADLGRVTLPTFILEPRSMLERITNFMAHPELMLPIPDIDDPVKRFVAVTKFYLSGWHIKPPGVKKPLNPILGEIFSGWWDYSDGTRGYYISEQTSHHPPKSSYFFMAPEHHIRIDGTLKPRSKFLGNSVGSFMEGIAVMRFTNRNERYFITQPNMYARGILFGKMKYELGDHAYVKCSELGLEADIEFKVKGWVGGTYNAIVGHIKDTKSNKNLFEITGFWDGEMSIKDLTTGKKEALFDATHAKATPPQARPLSEQAERESQRLWAKTTAAIKKGDHRAATDEKSMIEDRQREEATARGEGTEWKPKLFRRALGGGGGGGSGGPGDTAGEEKLDWVIDAKVDGQSPEELLRQIQAIYPVLPGSQRPGSSRTTSQQEQGGSSSSSAPAAATAAATQSLQQQQRRQENGGSNRATTQPPAGQMADMSLNDDGTGGRSRTGGAATAGPGLSECVQPRVTRFDSTEGSTDEFVDAHT